MKALLKNLFLFAGLASAMTLTSCGDEPGTTPGGTSNEFTVNFSNLKVNFLESGIWDDYLNPANTAVLCDNMSFSHTATVSQYGAFWNGFLPSKSTDTADYSDGNWIEHDFTSMTGGGVDGKGTPYMVAYWSTMEAEGEHSLSIKYEAGDRLFKAKSVYVNNTTYAYYVMQKGNPFASKFEQGDWLKVKFYGIAENDEVTGPVEFYLADYRSENPAEHTMVTDWTKIDLSALNSVAAKSDVKLKTVYLEMESSDSGQFGMNTPSYLAIDKLTVEAGNVK